MLSASCLVLVVSAQPASGNEEEKEGAGKQNVLSLLLGGTSDRDENAFTVGLDFEHRIHPLLSVGAVIEYATEDLDAVTLIGALDLHIWKGFAIQTGPGVEFAWEEEGEAGGTTSTNRRNFIDRVGALYEFEFTRLLVTPQVHYDYSSVKDAVVYAIGLGIRF